MATRTLTYTQWLKLVVRHALDDEYENLSGLATVDAAKKLDVHRSRIYQLIDEGVLDTLAITTSGDKAALVLVTQRSLDRYLASRVPDRGRQGYFAFPQT
jgi:hypothetical protein